MRWFACLIAGLLSSAPAHSFSIGLLNGNSGNVIRWGTTNVTVRLNAAGSADIVDGSDLQAVRAGWTQWNNISCSKMVVSEGALTSNLALMAIGGAPNGQNEVAWAEGPEWIYGQFVLGITNTSFSVPSAEIQEADIVFNGYLQSWSTTGSGGATDVLNVAAHEEGHFFGAQHNLGGYDPNNPPTMAPNADPFLKSQTLEPDDEKVLCFLYPVTEYTCTQNTDCPLLVDDDASGQEYYVGQVSCQNGLCGGVSAQLPEGTQTLGDDCASDFDCVDPLFCQPMGSGQSVCAKNCNTTADCGNDSTCFPYSNAPGGVCLPTPGSGGGSGSGTTGGPVATKSNGDQCNSSIECQSGLCVGGSSGTQYCRAPCSLGGNECPSGEACYQLQGSSNGACIPEEGGSGANAPGSPCTSPSECISGLCIGPTDGGYFCREGCDPALNNCPEAYACAQLVGGGGACIPANPKLGLAEPCDFSDDCQSGFCLAIQGMSGSYCSQECGECPCGMECSAFQGGQSFCTIGGPTACVPSGNPCDSADVCISQTCVAGICADPCILGVAACPPSQSCKRLKAGSTNGTCADNGSVATGQPCAADAECETNYCNGLCYLPCDPATTYCGDGMVCTPIPGEAVAVCQMDLGSDDGIDGTSGVDGTDGGGAADGEVDSGSDGAVPGVATSDSSGGCQAGGGMGRSSIVLLCLLLTLLAYRRVDSGRIRA